MLQAGCVLFVVAALAALSYAQGPVYHNSLRQASYVLQSGRARPSCTTPDPSRAFFDAYSKSIMRSPVLGDPFPAWIASFDCNSVDDEIRNSLGLFKCNWNNSCTYATLPGGTEFRERPTLLADTANAKLLVAFGSDDFQGTNLGLVRCNYDISGCESSLIPFSASIYDPLVVIDSVNAKLIAVAAKFTGTGVAMIRCNTDGTLCTQGVLGTGSYDDGSVPLIDTANNRLLVLVRSSSTPMAAGLFRCTITGTGCVYFPISDSQAGDVRFATPLIDSTFSKLLVVTMAFNQVSLYRCELSSISGCTYFDLTTIANSYSASTFFFASALIDSANGELVLLFNSGSAVPGLVLCELSNLTDCQFFDASAGAGDYSGYGGMASLGVRPDGELAVQYVTTLDSTDSLMLGSCYANGTSCQFSPLSFANSPGWGIGSQPSLALFENALGTVDVYITVRDDGAQELAMFICPDVTTLLSCTAVASFSRNAYDPQTLVDTANSRLLTVAYYNGPQFGLFLVVCSLNATACTDVGLADTALPNPLLNPFGSFFATAIDSVNSKLLVAAVSGTFSNFGIVLLRCAVNGSNCARVLLLDGQASSYEPQISRPVILIDSANAKLLVILCTALTATMSTTSSGSVVIRCELDGTACTIVVVEPNVGCSSWMSATIDVANAKLVIVDAFKVLRCELDARSCSNTDFSSQILQLYQQQIVVPINTNIDYPVVLIDNANAVLLILAADVDLRSVIARCRLDGSACSFMSASAGLPLITGVAPSAALVLPTSTLVYATQCNGYPFAPACLFTYASEPLSGQVNAPRKKSSALPAIIAGSVIGAIVLLALVGTGAFFVVRRRKNRSSGSRAGQPLENIAAKQ